MAWETKPAAVKQIDYWLIYTTKDTDTGDKEVGYYKHESTDTEPDIYINEDGEDELDESFWTEMTKDDFEQIEGPAAKIRKVTYEPSTEDESGVTIWEYHYAHRESEGEFDVRVEGVCKDCQFYKTNVEAYDEFVRQKETEEGEEDGDGGQDTPDIPDGDGDDIPDGCICDSGATVDTPFTTSDTEGEPADGGTTEGEEEGGDTTDGTDPAEEPSDGEEPGNDGEPESPADDEPTPSTEEKEQDVLLYCKHGPRCVRRCHHLTAFESVGLGMCTRYTSTDHITGEVTNGDCMERNRYGECDGYELYDPEEMYRKQTEVPDGDSNDNPDGLDGNLDEGQEGGTDDTGAGS